MVLRMFLATLTIPDITLHRLFCIAVVSEEKIQGI